MSNKTQDAVYNAKELGAGKVAVLGLQPNATFKFISFLYKIGSLLIVQAGFAADDYFFGKHTFTLLHATNH